MENRFGIKDLILFVLISLLIAVVFLGIKQYDREWKTIQEMNKRLESQTSDLKGIHDLLNRKGPINISSGGGDDLQNPDVDYRVRRIHASPDFAEGGKVVDIFQAVPAKLTALVNTDQGSQYIQGYVLDQLLDRDPVTLEFIPRLATKWEISADGLTIDFKLRRGVTFSDGTPLTPDDVVFTVNLTRNEKVECPALARLISTSSTRWNGRETTACVSHGRSRTTKRWRCRAKPW